MHIGVIGLGYWGAKHVRVLSGMSDVSRVTVFDAAPHRSSTLKATFPAVTVAPDVHALFQAVDAVVLATPPSSHAVLARWAMRAGCHVLVEKPLALSSRDAADVMGLARAKGLTLMVGHTFAYHPAVQALVDTVRRGDLGQVLHIDSQRLNLGPFQTDCDVIWDLAPHDVSIISMLLGASPTSVRTWARGHIDRAVADNAYVLLDYADRGAQAAIHVSWIHPHKVRQLTVVGSQRMAVYDDLDDDARIRVHDKGVGVALPTPAHEPPLTYRHGDIHCPYIPFTEPLLLEDQHFVDCVSTGAAPRTDGAAGLDVIRTLEAASISLAEGREVHLAELDAPARQLHLPRPLVRMP